MEASNFFSFKLTRLASLTPNYDKNKERENRHLENLIAAGGILLIDLLAEKVVCPLSGGFRHARIM